jgi:hypothetical protein
MHKIYKIQLLCLNQKSTAVYRTHTGAKLRILRDGNCNEFERRTSTNTKRMAIYKHKGSYLTVIEVEHKTILLNNESNDL